jgi:hypothetical protein
MNRHLVWFWLALLTSTLLVCGGCQSREERQQYVPPQEAAQRALEIALTSWQNGKVPPGLVQQSAPAIQLVDTQHPPNQKLTAFTVIGPMAGDVQRCFAVRLTFDNPREEVRARFVVVGIDPLWVIRYEDLEILAHWEHRMPANPPAPKKPQS